MIIVAHSHPLPRPIPSSVVPRVRSKRHSYVYLACDLCRARKKRCDRPPPSSSSSASATSPCAASSSSVPPLSCSQCSSARVPCVQSSTQRANRQRKNATVETKTSSRAPRKGEYEKGGESDPCDPRDTAWLSLHDTEIADGSSEILLGAASPRQPLSRGLSKRSPARM